MAGSTLTTTILINAQVGNGFTAVGDTLTALGAQVDQISDKLVSWGKDSTNTFKDYESSMAEAQTALAGNMGMQSKELDDAMSELDAKAREWASSTIFHTDEVGDAINKAAHAGWSYDAIIEAMPSAMRLAQAGGLDLAEAVSYVSRSMKALGVESGEMDHFIDIWTYAATHSVGDIESFGQTITTLGSVGRFTDTNEELFTMIALMQSMGESGSTAATMLRTTWMNMLAPSQTASLVLENLGATEEEIESIRDNEALKESLEMLGSLGFSPFDENGQAKPLLQTFSELRDVISGIVGGEGINSFADLTEMAGGTAEALDMIYKNQTADGVLGVIFGKRGIRGALNTFAGLDDALQLYADMSDGMAEGFSQYSADVMMDTLYGRVETYYSKIENLKLRVGEVLSSDVSSLAAAAGELADAVASMDEGKFNALVGGLEVLAGSGGALIGVGAAFRLIGFAISPLGAGVLSLIALAAAAKALAELEKVDFKEKFGDMSLDEGQIQSYIEKLTTDFNSAYEKVNSFSEALSTAVTNYESLTGSLKSNLITDMLTDADVSPGSEEYLKLIDIGKNIMAAVKEGISGNYEGAMEGVTATFGEDAEGNAIYAQIMTALEYGMENAIASASSLSTQLREAMLSAFKDGTLTGDELANIQAIMDQMNELVAQQQERENYINKARILRDAQTMGLDTIQGASKMMTEERDREWNQLLDRQAGAMYDTENSYRKMIEAGVMLPNTDGTEGTHVATIEDLNAAKAELASQQEAERYAWDSRFNNTIMELWTQGIQDSDLSGAWETAMAFGNAIAGAGGFPNEEAYNTYERGTSWDEHVDVGKYVGMMVDALGGRERLQGTADYFEAQGDTDQASEYRNLLAYYGWFHENSADPYKKVEGNWGPAIESAAPEFEQETATVTYEADTTAAEAALSEIEPETETIMFEGDTSAAQSAIDGLGGQSISIGITGDTSQVDAAISALSGRTVSVSIYTNPISFSAPGGGSGKPNAMMKYAEGGRATEASIFGEAGTEWAIPEEHSERTAALLNAARAASGFTWDDLLARNGGMNTGGNSVTLVYSPTINAQNADGVAEKLDEDKQRLEKWLKEREMMDSLEVFQ